MWFSYSQRSSSARTFCSTSFCALWFRCEKQTYHNILCAYTYLDLNRQHNPNKCVYVCGERGNEEGLRRRQRERQRQSMTHLVSRSDYYMVGYSGTVSFANSQKCTQDIQHCSNLLLKIGAQHTTATIHKWLVTASIWSYARRLIENEWHRTMFSDCSKYLYVSTCCWPSNSIGVKHPGSKTKVFSLLYMFMFMIIQVLASQQLNCAGIFKSWPFPASWRYPKFALSCIRLKLQFKKSKRENMPNMNCLDTIWTGKEWSLAWASLTQLYYFSEILPTTKTSAQSPDSKCGSRMIGSHCSNAYWYNIFIFWLNHLCVGHLTHVHIANLHHTHDT